MKKLILLSAILFSFFSIHSYAATETKTYAIEGMHCDPCAKGLAKAFKANEAVQEADVSFANKEMKLTFKEGKSLSDAEVTAMVEKSGFKIRK